MTTQPSDRRIVAPTGFASPEGGSFFVQLEDPSRRLTEDARGAHPAALAWQPRPITNTIGMLLAHVALVEVYWQGIAIEQPVAAS